MKYFQSKKIGRNCILCANGPILSTWSFIGLGGFSYNCYHDNSNKIIFKIKFSHFYISGGIISIAFILCTRILDTYYSLIKNESTGFIKTARIVTDNIFGFNSIVITTVCIVNNKYRMMEYKFLCKLLSSLDEFGLGNLLEEQKIAKTRNMFVKALFLMVGLITVYSLYFITYFSYESFIDFLKRATSILCFFIDFGIAFTFYMEGHMYHEIFASLHSNIKLTILSFHPNLLLVHYKLMNGKYNKVYRKTEKEFVDYLKKIHIVQNSFRKCFVTFNKFVNPGVVIWLVATMTMLVLNSYIIIRACIDHGLFYIDFVSVSLQLRIICSLVVINFCIFMVEKLSKLVRNNIKLFCKFN